MAKLTLTDIAAGYDTATIGATNNALVEAAVENTLSRDGTAPNQMEANLDMNSYRIQNLPTAVNNTEPVILSQAASLAGVTNPLTQNTVGAVLYPISSGETSAAVTPTNYYYPVGNVLRYGADSTGGTDSATAIQAAVDSSLEVFFPAGTYLCQTMIALRSNVHIYGRGATLQTDGTNYILSALGTVGTFSSITASITQGASTFGAAVGTGTTYAADSGWFLRGERVAQGTDTHKEGELGVVASVATDTITVDGMIQKDLTVFSDATITGVTQANPAVVTATAHGFENGVIVTIADVVGMTELNGNTYVVANKAANTFELKGTDSSAYAAYSSAGTASSDAQAAPVTFVENVTIEGLKITNTTYTDAPTTNTNALIRFDLVKNSRVTNCVLYENNHIGALYINTFNCSFVGNHVEKMRDDTGNGSYGYGIEVGLAAQNTAITGNTFTVCRHAVTTGTGTVSGSTPAYGIQRNVAITGNTVTNCSSIGLDTHEDSDGVTFSGNTVVGCTPAGIQSRSYRTSITGNTVTSCKGKGIRVSSLSLDSVIGNNVVSRIKVNSGDGYGIDVDATSVTITGNNVTYCDSHGIYIDTNASKNINIVGNECRSNGQVSGDGININRTGSCQRLTVVGNNCTDDQTTKTQVYGFHIESGVTTDDAYALVANNMFYANLTADFLNEGTGAPRGNNNIGWVTEANGTGQIISGTTADIITHGLAETPTAADISITVTADPTNTPGVIFVDTIGATYFTVNCENDPGASHLDFSWQARIL